MDEQSSSSLVLFVEVSQSYRIAVNTVIEPDTFDTVEIEVTIILTNQQSNTIPYRAQIPT